MSSDSLKISIYFLQKSEARNYLESQERLFLSNVLENLEGDENYQINEKESAHLQKILAKYRKYLNG